MFLLILLSACTKGRGDDTGPRDRDGDGFTEDCNDDDPSVFPGAAEHCDGVDEDCNGLVDDNALDAPPWYPDADNDGFGAAGESTLSCQAPAGYVTDASDCDDDDPKTSPAAYEICDGIDNDCDGNTDDASAINAGTWYGDGDGDGYGDPDSLLESCDQPDDSSLDNTDCDDADADIHPGAADAWYDGVDADCNEADDYDADADGHRSVDYGGDDCDDTDVSRWETCSLYEFNAHTFTTCGQTGRYGPDLSTCRGAYSTDWDEDNNWFTMTSRGIQLWTVPETGDYQIQVRGAASGSNSNYTSYPGRGSSETGTFALEEGEVLQIMVGQMGQSVPYHAGAGGGSFVVDEDDNPLIIAGGAGAPCRGDDHRNTQDATSSTTGVNSACSGGSTGSGGSSCSGNYGSGGGGFSGDGQNGPSDSTGGLSFLNGGDGGNCAATCGSNAGAGGFGGGGGTYHDVYGGGGGGYSGGGGGDYCRGGGGGASFNAGDNHSSQTGANTGDGSVTITKL